MKTKHNPTVEALMALCLAGSVHAESLSDAGRRYAEALESPQVQAMLEARVNKSNPYSRLSPELSELVQASKGLGPEDLQEKAERLDLSLDGQDVAVRLWANSAADMARLSRAVDGLGGIVEVKVGGIVYARLPVTALEEINDLGALKYAEPQAMYHANYTSTGQIGEGVGSTAVARLHQAGITGKQVKIGILDFGFTGYDALRARGEVPAPVATKAFNRNGDLGGGDVAHGTACAEIIHDMAPDAQVYLAAVGNGGSAGDADIIQAGRWLAEQGVDIINFSGGGHRGPKNGTAPIDQLVDEISGQGILWTIAAGNEGSDHWLGSTVDNNRNGFVDIPGNAQGDFMLIEHGGGELRITVSWDDWGTPGGPPSASIDVDAFLLRVAPNGQAVVVGQSTNPQQGRGRPIEMIGGQAPPGVYGLVLRASALRDVRPMHVLIQGARRFAPMDPTGSVGSPGTARSALTVGAVHAMNQTLEPYSSQGPTDDGRTKPEIVAPANNTSLAYRGRFRGTSAAAPHAAGFAALVKQTAPSLGSAELRNAAIRFVREMERPTPNNRVGYGHIDGGKIQVARAQPEPSPPRTDPQPPRADAGQEERLRPIAPLLELLGN